MNQNSTNQGYWSAHRLLLVRCGPIISFFVLVFLVYSVPGTIGSGAGILGTNSHLNLGQFFPIYSPSTSPMTKRNLDLNRDDLNFVAIGQWIIYPLWMTHYRLFFFMFLNDLDAILYCMKILCIKTSFWFTTRLILAMNIFHRPDSFWIY